MPPRLPDLTECTAAIALVAIGWAVFALALGAG